ncbi:hypothetical protein C1645_755033 [Glomus cerebriforme]|uniref:Uncharacterized protein n=1 Tax=Glomus cerebriforme TaxID=658196 RepID=A0A397TGA3_9GLOM|nr:hypothetical protein C1645_755033 [Glomus cerebriforme]
MFTAYIVFFAKCYWCKLEPRRLVYVRNYSVACSENIYLEKVSHSIKSLHVSHFLDKILLLYL